MDEVRWLPIRKNVRPIAYDLVEAVNGIILFAEAGTAVGVFGDGDGGGMSKRRELVREIVDMDGTVRAEIVIKNEKDVTHAERRL
jgi:hypothetical protein